MNHNGSITVRSKMPVSITLKNIPDDIYLRLKSTAEANRRSLNSEAIVCLEAILRKPKVSPAERLARIQMLTSKLDPNKFVAKDIDKAKREGRP
jgi:antitoxin FitA